MSADLTGAPCCQRLLPVHQFPVSFQPITARTHYGQEVGLPTGRPSCCVHNASTVPWTSAGQFGRPRGVRGRPWYDLWRLRCVISHPMDVRGLPPGRPPSGRPRDTQFGIDWSLLPSGCPQGVRTAEVQPITAQTHFGQEVGLPTVRPKPEVDVP